MTEPTTKSQALPLHDLRHEGILLAINLRLLYPRGLALTADQDGNLWIEDWRHEGIEYDTDCAETNRLRIEKLKRFDQLLTRGVQSLDPSPGPKP